MNEENNKWCNQNKKNIKVLMTWTLLWTVSMAIAVFGRKLFWHDNQTLSLIAILVNLVLGVAMIIANISYVKGLDELQQKIQLEAMGIALGVGVIGGLSYSLFAQANIIFSTTKISPMIILIGLTYAAATFIGNRRYK